MAMPLAIAGVCPLRLPADLRQFAARRLRALFVVVNNLIGNSTRRIVPACRSEGAHI
jgi:hypothetical protein